MAGVSGRGKEIVRQPVPFEQRGAPSEGACFSHAACPSVLSTKWNVFEIGGNGKSKRCAQIAKHCDRLFGLKARRQDKTMRYREKSINRIPKLHGANRVA